MGNRFSSGKNSIAECDRCGFRFKLKELRELVIKTKNINMLICRSCWEPDHPQLLSGMFPVDDPQGVRNPRPDRSYFTSGTLANGFTGDGSRLTQWGWYPVGGGNSVVSGNTPNALLGQGVVGTVSVAILQSGVINMSALSITQPYPIFTNAEGQPLENGYVWVGKANLDPQANPINLYWDTALTIPAVQPIRTINGALSNSGTPGSIYAAEFSYSMRVKNEIGQLVSSTTNATGYAVGNVVPAGQTVTLNVPSDFADVQAAFDYMNGWVIFGSVEVKIANGTYNWTRGQNCNHPFGENIRIVGNQASPSSVIIRGPTGPTFDMFSVSAGNTLGFIDGMTIDLPTKATLANNWTAILAVQGSTLITGTKIIVNNWYYGIAARDGSYIYCPDAQVSNSGDVGIWAFCGSTIVANGAVSNYASDTVNDYGFGFQSEFGSTLVATNAKAMGCYKAGFAALSNSTARIHNCESYQNVGSGFLSWAGGQVEAFGSSSHDNQKYGIEITEYGNIIGVSTNTNNTLGATSKFAYLDTSTGSARVASSSGNLRLDAEGTGGVYFHNGQGLQFGIGNSTSPTSFVEVRGGGADNGNQPQMIASGAATNIPIRYDAKGNGSQFFNNGNGLQFQIQGSVASTVNQVYVSGSKTGDPAIIGATGTDAIVDLALYPKGAGSYVRIGSSFVSTSDVPITGYIQIKDSSGTIRKIAVVA
jgi:hypothetical protein